MKEVMEQTLQELLKAYVEMNRLHAQPGEKCHMLANSIKFLEKQIKILIEGIAQY